ncbi:hypothetical protein [Actinomycetospora sp. NBC_00405]|uniref:hypothetical protein n=1 Tax=Actinomycetospora sp. NBC_00405 TaxID=2975952 RepID=UPI002E238E9A
MGAPGGPFDPSDDGPPSGPPGSGSRGPHDAYGRPPSEFGSEFGKEFPEEFAPRPRRRRGGAPEPGPLPGGQPGPRALPRGEGPFGLLPPGLGGGAPVGASYPARRAFRLSVATIAADAVRRLVTTTGGGELVVTLLIVLVGGFVALHFRGGAAWAQLALTVLAGLVMLSTVIALPGTVALLAPSPASGLVALVAGAVVVVCGVGTLKNAWST